MIGAVHSRANEVACVGIYANVVLVDVLGVDGARDQAAIGAHHKAAHLSKDGYIVHARWNQDLLIGAANALADGADCLLFGTIGDAHAAGEVDKANAAAGLLLQSAREVE